MRAPGSPAREGNRSSRRLFPFAQRFFSPSQRQTKSKSRRSLLAKRIYITTAIILITLTFALVHTLAAVSISTNTPYTQNFDSIGTAATATLPTDFRADKQTSVRKVGSYAAAGTSTANVGGANLGTNATNGIYNFGSGTTTAGGADRAVGFLSSGSGTQSGNLYVQLVNNTGGSLAGLTVSYDVEKYRSGSNPAGFTIQLYYSTDGATWTSAGSSFQTSFPADANNNGCAAAPCATQSVANQNLSVNVSNGSNVYLAWNYSVTSGSATTNAQALAVDNISILGIPGAAATNPSGVGAANPNSVTAGANTLLSVTVTPGANPTSSGLSVTGDLSLIGGSASQTFYDDGTHGDATANDNVFSFAATVGASTSPGAINIPVTITDAQTRSSNATIALTVQQPPPPSDHIVISQIYGGGGNSGAPYANDYIELYNPTSTTFDITGWSLQYASATGASWTNKQPLGGSIAPGEYYLVQLASGGANGQVLPAANITGSINMSATAGKIALVKNGDSLTGSCPVGNDPDIVDFVGYGSTASCWEGTARAAAPSSATALFRANGGVTDTNQNGSDFTTGAPNPRRTAPIVELGHWVASSDPTTDGTNVPHDATITVNFSEPVDVDASWFNINCASSGSHNDATIAHTSDFKSYAITPNVNFSFGEQCTVTIKKDAIHDRDTDDSAPNTDTLFADYVWSFTVVAAGDPAPYPPSVHLTMGNPSNAVADIAQPDNYLMMKPTYALSYNRDKGTPNWVSWHLTSEWYGTLARVDTFRADPAVPSDWYRVQATDYFSTGFDRGHMCPNADRDNQNRVPINQETYLMSNMVPQAPDNNQGPWANLENYLRTLTDAGNEIYIISGPAGVGGTGSNGGATTSVADGHVTVPAYTWKVALVLPKADGDDVSRVSAATRTIAVIMPNTQGIRTNDPNDWQQYLTTVDAVEQLTGYDFFSNVPKIVQNSIEAGVNGNNPPGTDNQFVSAAEDVPAQIALTAVSPDSNATFTYTISQPAHGSLSGTGGNLTYTPNANYHGSDSFTFSVNDGHANSNTSTVNINVTAVNDAPTANAQSVSTDEDKAASVTLSGTDVETALENLTYTVTVAPSHGTLSGTAPNLTYTPAADYNGADSFKFTVTDTGDGDSPALTSAEATVSITVNPVNDAPSANAQSVTTDEDTPKAITLAGSDVETPAASLTYQIVSQPSHGTLSGAAPNVVYTPAADYNGADGFQFTVTDTGDGASAALTSAPATVSITVNPVNDAPVPNNQSVTTAEDTPLNITLTGSDVDGDALTFRVISSPTHGTLSGTAPNLTYTPAADYNGNDSFTFKVNDGHVDSVAGAVSITVTPVNDPPVLTLPGDITIDAMSNFGSIVIFKATAVDVHDGGGSVPVVCTPNSGSVFAIGATTVKCTAKDAELTVNGSFVVNVRAPKTVGQDVLSQLIALRATVTDKQDGSKLDDAIKSLTASINASLWVDAAHPQPKVGDQIFQSDKDAVNKLSDLIKNKRSPISDVTLLSFIIRIGQADHVLAQIAIADAAARGGDPKKIDQAFQEILKGDGDALSGKADSAIEHYRNAWSQALKA